MKTQGQLARPKLNNQYSGQRKQNEKDKQRQERPAKKEDKRAVRSAHVRGVR